MSDVRSGNVPAAGTDAGAGAAAASCTVRSLDTGDAAFKPIETAGCAVGGCEWGSG